MAKISVPFHHNNCDGNFFPKISFSLLMNGRIERVLGKAGIMLRKWYPSAKRIQSDTTIMSVLKQDTQPHYSGPAVRQAKHLMVKKWTGTCALLVAIKWSKGRVHQQRNYLI